MIRKVHTLWLHQKNCLCVHQSSGSLPLFPLLGHFYRRSIQLCVPTHKPKLVSLGFVCPTQHSYCSVSISAGFSATCSAERNLLYFAVTLHGVQSLPPHTHTQTDAQWNIAAPSSAAGYSLFLCSIANRLEQWSATVSMSQPQCIMK